MRFGQELFRQRKINQTNNAPELWLCQVLMSERIREEGRLRYYALVTDVDQHYDHPTRIFHEISGLIVLAFLFLPILAPLFLAFLPPLALNFG
jgi:hypothetical protein